MCIKVPIPPTPSPLPSPLTLGAAIPGPPPFGVGLCCKFVSLALIPNELGFGVPIPFPLATEINSALLLVRAYLDQFQPRCPLE